MDENIISKIENFHYNEGDLILFYYKLGELPIDEIVETAHSVYDSLKSTYPNARIIGLPENIFSEIITISKDDPLNKIYRENYYNLCKAQDLDFEDDEL